MNDNMTESILTSVKKMMGIAEEYDHFDADLIMHINSVFFILHQLGLGLSLFKIESADEEWDDFIVLNPGINIEAVKTYMYERVRLIFDPPTNSSLLNAYKEDIKEFEWRLQIETETDSFRKE